MSWRHAYKIWLPGLLLSQKHPGMCVLWWWLCVSQWYLMVQNLMLRMSFCSIWSLMFSACQLLERGTWKVLCFHLHQCSVVGWACDHWKGGGEWECDGICLVVGSNCAKNQEVQDYCLESANVFDFHFISFCIFYSLLRLILLLTHRWSCCDILIHSSLTL